jgi:hypothetical protein
MTRLQRQPVGDELARIMQDLPAETYSADEMPDLAYCIERHQPDPGNEVGRWARQFLPPSGSIGTLELLTRLSQGINHGFLHRRREAKGIQLPVETLRLGHGSCRDFAMLRRRARSVSPRGLHPDISLSRATIQRSPQAAQLAGRPMPAICRASAGSISTHNRQRRQDRPCHRCGRARSAPRDPPPRHLHRVPIGPSRHGGASECHVRYARGNLGHSSTLRVATVPPTGLGGRGQGKLIERIDIRQLELLRRDLDFDALVCAGRALPVQGLAAAAMAVSNR